MSSQTHPFSNQPPHDDPIIERVSRSYFRMSLSASQSLGMHGGQLRAYLLFDQALRDGRVPQIVPLGYRQFTTTYNSHPDTTERWATLDSHGAIGIEGKPISPARFHVEDAELVDVQAIAPAGHALNDDQFGLLNDMLWDSARRNTANRHFAQQCHSKRQQSYTSLEGKNRSRKAPKPVATPAVATTSTHIARSANEELIQLDDELGLMRENEMELDEERSGVMNPTEPKLA
jgi:hypothetical protein